MAGSYPWEPCPFLKRNGGVNWEGERREMGQELGGEEGGETAVGYKKHERKNKQHKISPSKIEREVASAALI